MVQRIEKRLYRSKGAYHLVVPMTFVKEHGLEEKPFVEVFFNGELLVRPLKSEKKEDEPHVGGGC